MVLVGEDPASKVYVASKGKQTVEAGMNSYEHRLPADATQSELLALIGRLNADAEEAVPCTVAGAVVVTEWNKTEYEYCAQDTEREPLLCDNVGINDSKYKKRNETEEQ